MSATNRGGKRIDSDFYPTPREAFDPMLPVLLELKQRSGIKLGVKVDAFTLWEPSCGDRRLINWMAEAGLSADGDDLANGYNFLDDSRERDAIITNPPFSIAQEFIGHALPLSNHVFMLLRLNFLGAKHRNAWWKDNEPTALYILSDRPSFAWSAKCKVCKWKDIKAIETPRPTVCPACNGKLHFSTSDNAEYAWFVWSHLFTGIHHL